MLSISVTTFTSMEMGNTVGEIPSIEFPCLTDRSTRKSRLCRLWLNVEHCNFNYFSGSMTTASALLHIEQMRISWRVTRISLGFLSGMITVFNLFLRILNRIANFHSEVSDNTYRDGASELNNTEASFIKDGGISVDQRKMNAVRAYFEWSR